jgi:hypothetical protein
MIGPRRRWTTTSEELRCTHPSDNSSPHATGRRRSPPRVSARPTPRPSSAPRPPTPTPTHPRTGHADDQRHPGPHAYRGSRALGAPPRPQPRSLGRNSRTAPTPPRPRRRDGPRGRPADRHPTPARPHQHRRRSSSEGAVSGGSSSVPETAGFIDKQRSRPVRLVVVHTGSEFGVCRHARLHGRATVSSVAEPAP